MKSTSQISSNARSPRTENCASGRQRNFPLTDHSYQSNVETLHARSANASQEMRGGRELHTFRSISNEFFNSEAAANYIAEAVLFASITCIAAWPVGIAIYQLTRWAI